MKTLITAMLLLVGLSAFAADQPDYGFYLRAAGEPSPWLKSQDGQKIFLGERQTLAVHKSELSSQDNGNTRFHLSVTVPYDKGIGPSTYILIVAGRAYRQSGSGSSQEKTSSLSFYVSGEESVKQVSEFMGTSIVYRRHPHHNLLISFSTTEHQFSVGDEVAATLRIKNVGTNDVAFMKGGRNRAARDNQYVFSARLGGKQIDDVGTSYHFGGMASRRVLKPGEVFEDSISLNKWFSFDKTGIYELHGSYYLDFKDPNGESWRTIWEDYVSADFTVRIKEDGPSNKAIDSDKK